MLPQCQMHLRAAPARMEGHQSRQRMASNAQHHGFDYADHGVQSPDVDSWRSPEASRVLQSFPIRSSLSQGRAAAPAVSRDSYRPDDHRLRRKTPSGTVDAGYDGSPTRFSPGPPPMKQMVLTVPASSSFQTPSHLHSFQISRDQTAERQSLDNAAGPGVIGGTLLPMPTDVCFPPGPGPWPSAGPSSHQPRWPSAPYQAFLAPQRDTDLAFCPTQVLAHDHFAVGQTGSAPMVQPWFFGGSVNARGEPIHPITQSYGNASLLQSRQEFLSSTCSQTFHTDMQTALLGESSSDPDGLSRGSVRTHDQLTHSLSHEGRMHFQERALARAQHSYLNLLTWLQLESGKRYANEKVGLGQQLPQVPTRLLVHPKKSAPRPQGSISHLGHQQYQTVGPTSVKLGPHRHPLDDSECSLAPAYGHLLPASFTSLAQNQGTSLLGAAGLIASESLETKMTQVRNGPMNGSLGFHSPTSSLEILEALCQHSGWTWVEGIFLGGCLHFALEHYLEALDWFTAVHNADPR